MVCDFSPVLSVLIGKLPGRGFKTMKSLCEVLLFRELREEKKNKKTLTQNNLYATVDYSGPLHLHLIIIKIFFKTLDNDVTGREDGGASAFSTVTGNEAVAR